MMKKITLFIFLLTVSLGNSQEVLQDFESGGPRDPFGGAAFSLVTDPEAGGTRGQVALLTASASGAYYQGINIDLTKNVDLTSNKTMSMDVYSTSPITIAPKVVSGVSGAPDSTTSATHTGSGWETLSFTFDKGYDGTVTANGQYAVLVIYYLWKADNSGFIDPAIDRTFYVDNISGIAAAVDPCSNGIQDGDETGVDCGGSCVSCPVPPATAAPTPPARDAGDVLSLFSSAYADVTPSGLNTFAGASWDNFTIESADDTRRLTAPSPGGGAQFEYIGVPPLDLTDFTHMHVDFYVEGTATPGSVFQIFLINFPNHPDGGGSYNLNTQFEITVVGAGAWVSGDVELSTFINGGAAKDKIALVQFVAAGPAYGPIYIDNIYFHKNTTLGIEDFDKTSFSAYPNPTKDSWTVKTSNERISSIQVYDILGKNVLLLSPNTNEAKIDASTLKSGLYFAKVLTEKGISSIKLIKN